MNEATVQLFEHHQVLPPFGFQFPVRMTALTIGPRSLALISPVPIDDTRAAELAAHGDVHYLIAPNLLHSKYLAAASARYPQAKLLAPRALRTKRPALTIHGDLEDGLPAAVAEAITLVPIEGTPATAEFAFFHRASRTLVVTDLVFNIEHPRGWFANLLLRLVGCHGRLGMTRSWRFLSRDHAATAASIESLLALPFDTLVMAHGEVVYTDARTRLAEATRWFRPATPSLAA